MNPGLKVIWSFGGWTWSSGFTQAAANPTAFADSCYTLLNDSRWAGLFDGIDIDWEYPNACGLSCDSSGPASFNNVITALRNKFGSSKLITAAITADGSNGGKIDAADYAAGAQKLDWIMPMSYDYFGAFNPTGPTAPHSPLTSYTGIPQAGLRHRGGRRQAHRQGRPRQQDPARRRLLRPRLDRGHADRPGGSATGAAPGTYEAGIEDYKVLKNSARPRAPSAAPRTRSAARSGGATTPPAPWRARRPGPRTRDSAAPSSGSCPVTRQRRADQRAVQRPEVGHRPDVGPHADARPPDPTPAAGHHAVFTRSVPVPRS